MKAIFINAKAQTITEVDIDGGLASLRELIGCRLVDVMNLDMAPFSRNAETLFIDDEGLLCNPEYGFDLWGRIIAGNAVVIGCDDNGDSVSTGYRVEDLTEGVSFLTWTEDNPAPEPFAFFLPL